MILCLLKRADSLCLPVDLIIGVTFSLVASGCIVPSTSPSKSPKHAILIMLDTLRADRMSLYGHARATTPFLTDSKSRLLVYNDAKAPAPWTVPTHASIFTGQLPAQHHAQWGNFRLDSTTTTLAEVLKAEGFCTVGLSTNGFVSPTTGLSKGFDVYRMFQPEDSDGAAAAAAKVIGMTERCERLFLFVNLMDTHIPYNYDPYAAEFGVENPPVKSSADKWEVSSQSRSLSAEERQQLRASYDAAVRVADDRVAALFGAMRTEGVLEESLVVVTSDHGEGLGSHAEIGHVLSVWEEQLHVPLVVSLPGDDRDGSVFRRRVSLAGLGTSMLTWLDVEVPQSFQVPILEETSDLVVTADYRNYFLEDRRSFNQQMRKRYPDLDELVSHRHVVYCDQFKLIASPDREYQLYNLDDDPSEQRDLAGMGHSHLATCVESYDSALSDALLTPFSYKPSGRPANTDEIEKLKALGYVQ